VNRTFRMLGVATAMVMAMLASLMVAPSAAAWEPKDGALFNNPRGDFDARWRVVNHVNKAVAEARPGSRIMFSTFLMDSKTSANALLKAHRRGVKVQVVMDGDDAFTGQAKRLRRAFNADNRKIRRGDRKVNKKGEPRKWGPDQSFVVFCDGSCRAGRANNHSKFYVFTRTGKAKDVVMVSSSNLNKGGAVRGFNDLYIARGRGGLVDKYASIHAEMARDSGRDGDRYREYKYGQLTTRFYPKSRGGDPVLRDLDKVRCKGAKGGAGHRGRTVINVSMFAWNSTRGMAVARRLVQLARARCEVSIIYGAPSKIVAKYLRKAARKGHVELWDSRYDRDGDGLVDIRVHHKYLLISGRYGDDRSAWRVHTGSQNWGRGTLTMGDENTVNIASRRVYRQYISNWRMVTHVGARRIHR
jgi:phosphatidylserine/phosphatidylglycerophosphate/cardiolipin synthase-like enzyme